MNRGAKFLAAAAGLTIAACANSGKLELRPIASRTAADNAPLPQKLAEGYAQLRLGNAGLANELFRQSLREDPASAEANAGLAASYDHMGRFDLSRRYFEAALAIRPADTRLLERFAASLDRQGARAEAAAVRGEIATRLAQVEDAETKAHVAVVEAPEPAPAEPAQAVTDAPKAPMLAELAAPVVLAPTPPAQPPEAIEPAPVIATPAPIAAAAIAPAAPAASPAPVATPAPIMPAPAARPARPAAPAVAPVVAASITVQLPPARPAPEPVRVAAASPAPAPAPAPEPVVAEAPSAAPAVPLRADPRRPDSPRLQRLSLVEVALVTTGVSRWRPQVVAQTAQSTTIRFVPLKKPQQAFAGVRLLNAARSQGLAAHTRNYLTGKGWRRIAIGDANETRETSIILYPESRRRTAEILAAQFRMRVARRAGNDQAIVMLLGRDAARLKANRTSA